MTSPCASRLPTWCTSPAPPSRTSRKTRFALARDETGRPSMTQPADLVAASRAHGVRDPRLLKAIAAIPRVQFVPPDLAAHAYQDAPLPIPHGQVTTQPSLVTQMVEALELSSSDR